jgi:subtilisin family serine protease
MRMRAILMVAALQRRRARVGCTCAFARAGKGVTIYVLDSGLVADHQEFQPWTGGPSRARAGPNFVTSGVAHDCDGHGTHVASTGVAAAACCAAAALAHL